MKIVTAMAVLMSSITIRAWDYAAGGDDWTDADC